MWAQDALAMYGYAASSAVAGRLDPLTAPPQPTNPAGGAGQAAAVSQAAASVSLQQMIGNAPNAVMSLASPVTSAAAAGPLGSSFVQNAINGVINTGAWFTTAGITTAVFLNHTLNTLPAAGAAAATLPGATAAALAHTATPAGIGGAPLLAGLSKASAVGGLSVPPGWSTGAPAMTVGTTALEGSGWAAPAEAAPTAGLLGAPGAAIASKGAGAYAGPRYGVKPVIMPKLVVV